MMNNMNPENRTRTAGVLPVQLLRAAEEVAALLQGDRLRLLEELQRPDSAAGLARRLGTPRQQLNYHLRELERVGLVELVEERRRGNCTERVLRATARGYVISPEVLGRLGNHPEGLRDHFSSSYLVAVAARALRDLGELMEQAKMGDQRLATMTLESEVRFASAVDSEAFAKELSDAVARLVVKYHGGKAEGGRCFRLLLAAYPSLVTPEEDGPTNDGD